MIDPDARDQRIVAEHVDCGTESAHVDRAGVVDDGAIALHQDAVGVEADGDGCAGEVADGVVVVDSNDGGPMSGRVADRDLACVRHGAVAGDEDSHAVVAEGDDAGGGVDDRVVHAGEDAGAVRPGERAAVGDRVEVVDADDHTAAAVADGRAGQHVDGEIVDAAAGLKAAPGCCRCR